ncbi:E3 ubiquitin-protein ligase RNF25 [Tachyglossus aculeatus]|uniref:E3 ubiquitin-protein ligase RNF25 n=1 Tax=Tachyglossus aculeatus TaxID=9261 RepID=UPI0018F314E1|nr:E3 ubiquitin-protein ligase RNF25 [Tachyglossus aculeatus]
MAEGAAAGDEDWVLPSEVEVLESIYLDELRVARGDGKSAAWEICITLHPATAEDHDSQFVCFTLVLLVSPQYPNEAPEISIRNPRGLSDEQIHKISQALSHVAEAGLGGAVLYELIEKGKEILTRNNVPHGQCVICLYGFQEKEAFTKTPCYHYFHCHCLARYVQHMEQEIRARREEEDRRQQQQQQQPRPAAPAADQGLRVLCPVCREPLSYDLAALQAAPPPQHPTEPYRPDADSLRRQRERQRLFQRQQRRGGIIDPEAERNRYFISLQQPPAPAEPAPVVDTPEDPRPEATAAPLAAPEEGRRGPAETDARRPGRRDPRPPGEPPSAAAPPEEPPTDRKAEGREKGPAPRRTWDCGRWERAGGRGPAAAASYPRLPARGRGLLRPGLRREPPDPGDGS